MKLRINKFLLIILLVLASFTSLAQAYSALYDTNKLDVNLNDFRQMDREGQRQFIRMIRAFVVNYEEGIIQDYLKHKKVDAKKTSMLRRIQFLLQQITISEATAQTATAPSGQSLKCLFAGWPSLMYGGYCLNPINIKNLNLSGIDPYTGSNYRDLIKLYSESYNHNQATIENCPNNSARISCNPALFGKISYCPDARDPYSHNASLTCLVKANENNNLDEVVNSLLASTEGDGPEAKKTKLLQASFKELVDMVYDLCLCGSKNYKYASGYATHHRTCYALVSRTHALLSKFRPQNDNSPSCLVNLPHNNQEGSIQLCTYAEKVVNDLDRDLRLREQAAAESASPTTAAQMSDAERRDFTYKTYKWFVDQSYTSQGNIETKFKQLRDKKIASRDPDYGFYNNQAACEIKNRLKTRADLIGVNGTCIVELKDEEVVLGVEIKYDQPLSSNQLGCNPEKVTWKIPTPVTGATLNPTNGVKVNATRADTEYEVMATLSDCSNSININPAAKTVTCKIPARNKMTAKIDDQCQIEDAGDKVKFKVGISYENATEEKKSQCGVDKINWKIPELPAATENMVWNWKCTDEQTYGPLTKIDAETECKRRKADCTCQHILPETALNPTAGESTTAIKLFAPYKVEAKLNPCGNNIMIIKDTVLCEVPAKSLTSAGLTAIPTVDLQKKNQTTTETEDTLEVELIITNNLNLQIDCNESKIQWKTSLDQTITNQGKKTLKVIRQENDYTVTAMIDCNTTNSYEVKNKEVSFNVTKKGAQPLPVVDLKKKSQTATSTEEKLEVELLVTNNVRDEELDCNEAKIKWKNGSEESNQGQTNFTATKKDTSYTVSAILDCETNDKYQVSNKQVDFTIGKKDVVTPKPTETPKATTAPAPRQFSPNNGPGPQPFVPAPRPAIDFGGRY